MFCLLDAHSAAAIGAVVAVAADAAAVERSGWRMRVRVTEACLCHPQSLIQLRKMSCLFKCVSCLHSAVTYMKFMSEALLHEYTKLEGTVIVKTCMS